ncbi:hypothetical protein BGZ98_000480 [Dissophora globulifera]|uniref:Mitochondrial ribosomal protein subunit L20-domain-containing protein n=1 Tax=Dissophora globulifera TaxID=979702 RepID=A0A9P6R2Z5_9FUNG|nr:hypothetical protein BGZ98_000480 [Dissophora globulifera]KAG0310280.1 hypothetical protein BGZ99_000545 [Dissophora globulifera]
MLRTASAAVQPTAPALARSYGTNVTRTLFPRHYRLRAKVLSESDASPLQDGSLFIRRPTASPTTTSILSSTNPSPASVSSRTPGSATTTPLSHPDLPPPLRSGAAAAARRPEFATLTPEQIAEMRALRLEKPSKYTRSYLAKKYNVSDMFVKCYVPTSKEVQIARIRAQQRSFDSKGWKAQEIVVQRQKRRELW